MQVNPIQQLLLRIVWAIGMYKSDIKVVNFKDVYSAIEFY